MEKSHKKFPITCPVFSGIGNYTEILGLTPILLLAFACAAQADPWTVLGTRGTPLQTYPLGSYMNEDIWSAISQDTSASTVELGFGPNDNDAAAGYTWYVATWDNLDGANNWWKYTSDGVIQMTTTGNWYYLYRYVGGWWGTTYASLDWSDNPGSTAYSYVMVTNLPWSTDCWVTNGVGPESLSLNWSRPGPFQVMVVRRLGDWPDPPVNGTSYTNEQTYGSDDRNRVVYATGTGSSTFDRELAANPASNYYYSFYTENYSYYSLHTGVVYSARQMYNVTPAFYPGEHVDSFAYFAPKNIAASWNKGTNWYGPWNFFGNGAAQSDAGSLSIPANYPTNYGNKLRCDANYQDAVGVYRDFDTYYTTGRFYVAYVIRPDAGAGRYCGIDLKEVAGGSDKTLAFVGVLGGGTAIGIEPQYTPGQASNSAYSATSGDDHTIIVRYDFSDRNWSMLGYYKTDTIPLTEPATWQTWITNSYGWVTNIGRIAVVCGGWGGGGADPGNMYYDEIRIANSWEDLLQNPTYNWDDSA
ncbi:MAG: hypothetical protein EOM20_20885, partial [Spartobacteria bacterium]|nr:hypothetical protein [Spartobacteria bacterium]